MIHVLRLPKILTLVFSLLLLATRVHAEEPILTMVTDDKFVPTYSVFATHVMGPVNIAIDIQNSSTATVDFTLSNVTSWDGGCMNHGSDGGSTPDMKLWSGISQVSLGLPGVRTSPPYRSGARSSGRSSRTARR